MKERPILMSAPMVRAILDGSKTQTRRIMKPQPQMVAEKTIKPWRGDAAVLMKLMSDIGRTCPYGQPGDRLWVRETWQHSNWPDGRYDDDCGIFYRADYFDDPHGPDGELSPEGKYRTWRPSIHMPRAASRITLEITGVRVEQLQDISEADAQAEGARECDYATGREVLLAGRSQRGSYILHYRHIWEEINGAGSWNANPWVWAIDFRRA